MSVRVIIMVADVAPEGFTVFVPRWRENEAILLSRELIHEKIAKNIKIGTVLTANVNAEAERMEDLVFTDFRLTPDEDLLQEPA